MSQQVAVSVECPQCGETIHARIWTLVDGTRDPKLRARLLAGQLNYIHCPCTFEALLIEELLYHDRERRLMICLQPAGETAPAPHLQALAQHPAMAGYALRLVDSWYALVEKIALFERGYDDQVMELYKGAVLTDLRRERPGDYALYFLEEEDAGDGQVALAFVVPDLEAGVKSVPLYYGELEARLLPLAEAQPRDAGWQRVDAAWARQVLAGASCAV